MVRNSTDSWYFKLSCGHLRFISLRKINVVEGETVVYCKKCDDDVIVLHKESRF